MRKRILSCLIVFSILLVTSCNLINTGAVSTSEESQPTYSSIMQSSFATSDPTQTTAVTSYSIGYTINTGNFNVSFEDILNLCEEITGINLDELAHSEYGLVHTIEQDDYHIKYIDNYRLLLNRLTQPDEVTGTVYDSPEDYELHISRRIIINDFIFDELDDEYWAEVYYSKILDRAFENDSISDESRYEMGYFFWYNDVYLTSKIFYADYISGGCVMWYEHIINPGNTNVNQTSNENYAVYLELCDRLGLPTSSEMTEEVEQLMTTPNPEPFFVTETGPSYQS